MREGTQPTNQLWYVDLKFLPEFEEDKALDFAPYDFNSGPMALPVAMLVDNFEASYEYVANEGMLFTFQTNYQAPLYRSAVRMYHKYCFFLPELLVCQLRSMHCSQLCVSLMNCSKAWSLFGTDERQSQLIRGKNTQVYKDNGHI